MTLAAILTALGGALIGALIFLAKRLGKVDAAIDKFEDEEKRRKESENAGAKERNATDGLDDASIRERLRKRKDVWYRM